MSCHSTTWPARNFSNLESFGFFLTDQAFSAAGEHQRPVVRNDTIDALLSRSVGGKTTLASLVADLSARQLACEGGTA
jgi:hypothetical protein